jgi:hypothetical protein
MGLPFSVRGWGESRHRSDLGRPARLLREEVAGVFHACSLFFLAIAEMATDGNACCHLHQGVTE